MTIFNKKSLQNVKTCVLGIQGSGKTYFTKNTLVKSFKNPLVYAVHLAEWENEAENISVFSPNSYTLDEFNLFCYQLIGGKKQKTMPYDVLIIDEADMFFKSNFYLFQHINDLFINHRHYGIAIVFVTRRPQDITTKIYESSEHLFIFAIEGVNVKKHLENLHEEMKILLQQLHKDKHNFIYKRIGEKPQLFRAVSN